MDRDDGSADEPPAPVIGRLNLGAADPDRRGQAGPPLLIGLVIGLGLLLAMIAALLVILSNVYLVK